jgi:hypothetical protein
MTEAEWLACDDPYEMLSPLLRTAGPRKLRLFGVACCDRIRHLLADERSRAAVEAAGRFADGLCDAAELDRGCDAAELARTGTLADARWWAASAACSLCAKRERIEVVMLDMPECLGVSHAAWSVAAAAGEAAERPAQVALLRDVFGPLPFRPVAIDPAWLWWIGGTVPAIARRIYDDRRWEDMPILADALMDAGCDNSDILDHCRKPGEHVRGCWVVDLLLGKE